MKVSITEFANIKERVFSYERDMHKLDEWLHIFKYEMGYKDSFHYSDNFVTHLNAIYYKIIQYGDDLFDFSLEEETIGIASVPRCFLFQKLYECLQHSDYSAFCEILEQYENLIRKYEKLLKDMH